MSSRFRKRAAALVLTCAVVGGAAGFGGAELANSGKVTLYNSSADRKVTVRNVSSGSKQTSSEVYADNVNSTVGITTSTTKNIFGYQTQSAASGSGFIVSSDGYIVTNYHVIDGADKITVTTYNGKKYTATVRGYDEDKDIAVLKIDATGLNPVTLGNSDDVNVGDDVITIGNPLGELTFSLTSGQISSKSRDITTSDGTTMKLMQTDAAINSGNSGGALFNMYGEVIGITNAKYSSSSSSEASIDNIGFAIPISSVKSTIEDIIENGTKKTSSSTVEASSAHDESGSSYYSDRRSSGQGGSDEDDENSEFPF